MTFVELYLPLLQFGAFVVGWAVAMLTGMVVLRLAE